MEWVIGAGIFVGIGTITLWLIQPWVASRRRSAQLKARQLFHFQRERLEAKFFDIAKSSGRPHGLQWLEIDWEDGVKLVRDRKVGNMIALVGITIRFAAVAGGGMEDNPNVANLRDATAVFHFHKGCWATQGRVLFNMNPDLALDRYQDQYELVAVTDPPQPNIDA